MTDEKAPVITVDGPSGSGKGTVSQRVARALGWRLLDSGALYRVLALAARRRGLALDDEPVLAALAGALDVAFEERPGEEGVRVLLGGEDVTGELRTEACGEAASRVAALPAVREALLGRQRAFRVPPGLVADGRDMGTVVFPDAPLKIYLTASADERARRRWRQLRAQGVEADLAALYREIAARDARDASRKASPLRPAADAVQIDTTGIGIEEVVARVLALAAEAGLAPAVRGAGS